jgi:hypothetical protein
MHAGDTTAANRKTLDFSTPFGVFGRHKGKCCIDDPEYFREVSEAARPNGGHSDDEKFFFSRPRPRLFGCFFGDQTPTKDSGYYGMCFVTETDPNKGG